MHPGFHKYFALGFFFIFLIQTSAVSASPDGRELYKNHCARCHGDDGRGDGPAHTMQRPWPRDFHSGEYKLKSTPPKTLPTQKDVESIIRNGNNRTSMPGFGFFLSDEEISALAEYVLNISKAHSEYPEGTSVTVPEFVSEARTPEALKNGQKLFNDKCASCHGQDGRGLGTISGFLRDPDGFWAITADLTDPLAYGGGSNVRDIWTRLKTGIALSSMPSYDGVLTDEEMADISHYVKSLQIKTQERTLVKKEDWKKALPPEVRGEYMTRAMSCALCHNSYDEDGMYYPDMYLAGGVAITLPGLGVFYTRNITPHAETGVGNWSNEDLITTFTTGYAPDRRLEAFSMPWTFFSHLTDEDAEDITAYLKSLKPIENKVPDRFYYPVHERLFSRARQLIGLEYGRLEYPPFNQGTAVPEKEREE